MFGICRFVDFQEVAPFYTASWDTAVYKNEESWWGMCKAQSAEAVPNCFGTRDQLRGRQFLHGLGRGRMILGMSQAHLCLLCSLFLLLLHQLHISSLGIRSQSWGPLICCVDSIHWFCVRGGRRIKCYSKNFFSQWWYEFILIQSRCIVSNLLCLKVYICERFHHTS